MCAFLFGSAPLRILDTRHSSQCECSSADPRRSEQRDVRSDHILIGWCICFSIFDKPPIVPLRDHSTVAPQAEQAAMSGSRKNICQSTTTPGDNRDMLRIRFMRTSALRNASSGMWAQGR